MSDAVLKVGDEAALLQALRAAAHVRIDTVHHAHEGVGVRVDVTVTVFTDTAEIDESRAKMRAERDKCTDPRVRDRILTDWQSGTEYRLNAWKYTLGTNIYGYAVGDSLKSNLGGGRWAQTPQGYTLSEAIVWGCARAKAKNVTFTFGFNRLPAHLQVQVQGLSKQTEYKMAKTADSKSSVTSVPFNPSIVNELKVRAAAGAIVDPDEDEEVTPKPKKLRKREDVAQKGGNEQLEANRKAEVAKTLDIGEYPVTKVFEALHRIETKLDALSSSFAVFATTVLADAKLATVTKERIAKEALSVPAAPAEKTYGKGTRKASKGVEDGEADPHGVTAGDFIVDDGDWYKVLTVSGKGWYACVHHQSGEEKSFRGTPKFYKRTKRKNTACWTIV